MRRLTALALRRPRLSLALWLAGTVALSIAGIGVEERLAQPNFVVAGTPSAHEFELQRSSFGSSISFAVLLRGPDAQVEEQGRRLAADLSARPYYDVLHPWQRGSHAKDLLIGGGSLVVISVDAPVRRAADIKPLDVAEDLQAAVDRAVSDPVGANVTGQATIGRGLQEASLDATLRAEMIAAPLLIIILLLVFRSIVAALIPLVIGGATVSAGFGALSLASAFMPIDALATTFASMLGLALGVDYSLLLVSRFREEMNAGDGEAGAAARAAAATAGYTVLSAGLLLMIGMAVAMAILPGGILFSAAVGSVLVTALSLVTAVVVLPCALQLLGPRVNKGTIRLPGRRRAERPPERLLTRRVAAFAFGRPLIVGLTLVAALLLVSSFARDIRAVTPNADLLPADSRELRDYREFTRLLGPGWGAPFRLTLRSDDGPLTSAAALETIADFERDLARQPGVAFVAGPGQLEQASVRLGRVPGRLTRLKKAVGGGRTSARRLTRALRSAGTGAGRLETGLTRLSTGTDDLQAGAVQAGSGQTELTLGTGRAADGSARLQAGAGDVRAGAGRLTAGLERVAAGMRELERGLDQVRRRIDTGKAELLASGLDGSASAAQQLREPARSAAADLQVALDNLNAMTAGKLDPRYVATLTAVSRASGAVTGRNPVTGARVREGYDGLDASLGQLSAGLTGAAAAVRATAGDVAELRRGIERLAAGASRVRAGVVTLERGGRDLRTGARELADRTAELRRGLDELEGGSTRVGDALDRLGAGAGDLGGGIDRGSAGAGELGSGLQKVRRGVDRGAARLPGKRELASIDAGAKGFFGNPFAVLAAVDSGGPDRRAAAGYVLSVREGGEGARLVIIPETGVTDPRTAQLRDRLDDQAADLGRRTGFDAALGGEAAQVLDFQEATMSRLLLLMLVLAITNAIVLMFILRSLLLPIVAVLLNLLTVAAAFGTMRLLFQGDDPLGGGPGYLDTLALTGTFTVIFALSIDYQLFLLARMREGYRISGSVEESVTHAITHTGGVILGAAAIMIAVFAAFGLGEFVTIRQLGVGLTVAIVLDATVIRLLILPAAVRLLGHRAWWFPGVAA